MLLKFFSILVSSLLLAFPLSASALAADKPGRILDYPYDLETQANRPHQLRFEFPKDEIARIEFRSEEFFAIILKSAEQCGFKEQERLEVQEYFPNNKVFMDRFGCPDDIEEYITYTNVNQDYAFIAVYGGKSFNEAASLFNEMKLNQEFPGANIRKMQAVLAFP